MMEKIKQNKNVIVILVLLVLGIYLLSSGKKQQEDNLVTHDTVAATTTELITDNTSDVSASSSPENVPTINPNMDVVGHSNNEIIGYDEEKFPIYVNAQRVDPVAQPIAGEASIASTGGALIANLQSVDTDTYEQIKPDLLELIDALKELIVDLKNFIAARQSMQ